MSGVYHDAGDNDDIILSGFHGTNIDECRYLNYLYTAFITSVNWMLAHTLYNESTQGALFYVYMGRSDLAQSFIYTYRTA
jgi:hypothetical protein